MIPTIQAVTITVSSLERSRHFYEDILGFEPDTYYEPTRWQCYKSEGRAYLGITEDADYQRPDSQDIINFDVEDLEQLWQDIEGKCIIETPLGKTPWGSYKFVIRDPDGYKLGFCQKK
jgi:catechol 2,3-dioxygenase-like lactoylglutathione lyase family enzyme